MARQRIKGRARSISAESRLARNLEIANRKLNRLEKSKYYGKYSSKKLFRMLSGGGQDISYSRSRKGKLKLETVRLNVSQIRYYNKVIEEFINSAMSSPITIDQKRAQTREKLKESLSEITDQDIDDEDIDDFYTLVGDDDYRYIADKIGDSETYILVMEAREKGLNETEFVGMLEQYITVNTKEVRDAAKRLYKKYVRK